MINNIEEVENFLEELKLKNNISNITIVAYRKDLIDYLKYMEDKHINIFELKEEEYKKYFDVLKEEFKITTLKRKYSSIKNFYKYLWKNKLVSKIFEYELENIDTSTQKYTENKNIKIDTNKLNPNFNYKNFINSLGESLNETRLKVISILIAKFKINLVNIFEIQIKDLIKYDFKKIVVSRNNKIYSYDLDESTENILKSYYENYAFEKRFFFSKYNIQSFRTDLKKYDISLADLKIALLENEENMYENIKKIYFEIGIGDK